MVLLPLSCNWLAQAQEELRQDLGRLALALAGREQVCIESRGMLKGGKHAWLRYCWHARCLDGFAARQQQDLCRIKDEVELATLLRPYVCVHLKL